MPDVVYLVEYLDEDVPGQPYSSPIACHATFQQALSDATRRHEARCENEWLAAAVDGGKLEWSFVPEAQSQVGLAFHRGYCDAFGDGYCIFQMRVKGLEEA